MAKTSSNFVEHTNVSQTYAWMIYQLYDHWMTGLRKSLYLSCDLAELSFVNDDPMNYEEMLEKFQEHMRNTDEKRVELIQNYNRGIKILQAIYDNMSVPFEERKDITVRGDRGPDGKRTSETISMDDMEKEMDRIISAYESGKDVSALDIALKNAYAMYTEARAIAPDDMENIKAEQYILQQVKASASKSLLIMERILKMYPKLKSDYIFEIKSKSPIGGDKFEGKSAEETDQIFVKDMGAVFCPAVSEKYHLETLGDIRKANYKGMGEYNDRYSGKMETPYFDFLTPLIFSAPGAGKNSILEQMATTVGAAYRQTLFPEMADTDYSMGAYDGRTASVGNVLTKNMLEIGTDIALWLGDETLRRNVEGRTGLDTSQERMLHRQISAQNPRYKMNPGTFFVLATNTDKDSKIGETEQIGKANRDRVIGYGITEEMIQSGRPRFMREKYGKKLEPGTPLYALYEFLASTDPELGAAALLNQADINTFSNHEDLSNPKPSGRPVTQILDLLIASGERRVTMDKIVEVLRPVAGSAFIARFKTFAKIANAIPSIDEMFQAVEGVKNVVAATAFDVRFNPFDKEEGKFVVNAGNMSPDVMYAVNGGLGLPESTRASLEKKFKDPKNLNTQTLIEKTEASLKYYEGKINSAKKASDKALFQERYKEAKAGYDFLKNSTLASFAKETEDYVNSIYKVKGQRDENGKLVHPDIARGLSDPMVQKLIADRIITSVENYIESSYDRRLHKDGQPKPLSAEVMKKYLSIIAFCPFENQRSNMMAQLKNIMVNVPSDRVTDGIINVGIKKDDDEKASTGKMIFDAFLEDSKRRGGGNNNVLKATNKSMLNIFFLKLPVFNTASQYSPSFKNMHSDTYKSIEISSDISM